MYVCMYISARYYNECIKSLIKLELNINNEDIIVSLSLMTRQVIFYILLEHIKCF